MIERALALLLLNALWQPILIAAVTFAVLRLARSASASTRCAVLTTGLVVAVLVPLGSAAALTFAPVPVHSTAMVWNTAAATIPKTHHVAVPPLQAPAHTRAQSQAQAQSVSQSQLKSRSQSHTRSQPQAQAQSVSQSQLKSQSQARTQSQLQPQSRGQAQWLPQSQSQARWTFVHPHIAVSSRILMWIVIAWALVALVLILRLGVSLWHLARLRRDALPLAPASRAQLERWEEKTAGTNLRLCVSDETPVPIAIGLFDGMVLIPRRLVEELDSSDLDRIVLHEIAHLRRRDGIIYGLQQIAAALFFFSPGLWWIAHTLDIEREVACDDWVLERKTDAAPYATCLVRLAERTPWPHEALPAPGAFITRHSMSIRVERILRHKRDGRLRAAPATLACAMIGSMAIGIAAFSFAPSLADPEVAHTSATQHHVAQVKWKAPAPAMVANVAATVSPSATAPGTATPRTAAPIAKTVPAQKPVHRAAHARRLVILTTRSAVQRQAQTVLIARATAAPKVAGDDDYISQMESLFGHKLRVEDLISLKSLSITPQFVQGIRAEGYPDATVEQIITARAVDLTPDRIAALRSAFGPLTLHAMTTLAALHIDPAYRDQMSSAGLHDLTPERLVQLRSLNITPDYITKANAFGFGPLTPDQIVELKSLGIDEPFLQKVHAHGFEHPTINQVIQLKASGVIP